MCLLSEAIQGPFSLARKLCPARLPDFLIALVEEPHKKRRWCTTLLEYAYEQVLR